MNSLSPRQADPSHAATGAASTLPPHAAPPHRGTTTGKIRNTETRIDHYDPALAERIRRDPPQILSIAEAAAYLGISPRTVRARIDDHRLTFVRLGGRVMLRIVDLDRDLDRLLRTH